MPQKNTEIQQNVSLHIDIIINKEEIDLIKSEYNFRFRTSRRIKRLERWERAKRFGLDPS